VSVGEKIPVLDGLSQSDLELTPRLAQLRILPETVSEQQRIAGDGRAVGSHVHVARANLARRSEDPV
jgi:hypothetical protein